jgi:hypothetical protein
MVVETMWPEYAPWWLNMFIWMATFWWYILVGFVPAFYIAVAKLFGMPLLQRWQQEVVIMLYPNKVKFRKITDQFDPYFRDGKGIYWPDAALKPEEHIEVPERIEAKLMKLKEKYDTLSAKENRTPKEEKEMKNILKLQNRVWKMQVLTVRPINQVHIFSHPINQPIHNMKRREAKIGEITHNNNNPRRLKGHGIWIMQNPRLHFHRHYQLIVDHTSTFYKLIPVKQRQQFSIGFWHSLGIIVQKEVEVEGKEIEVEGGTSAGKQLVQQTITTQVIAQQMSEILDYPNFSASRMFTILKRRAKIESPYGFEAWISGKFDMRIILLLAGMLGVVACIFLFLHGGGTSPAPATGGPKMLL